MKNGEVDKALEPSWSTVDKSQPWALKSQEVTQEFWLEFDTIDHMEISKLPVDPIPQLPSFVVENSHFLFFSFLFALQ